MLTREKETGIPVLPVVLVNTDRVFPHPLVIKPQPVYVIVHPPVSYREFKGGKKDERETMTRFMDSIRDTIQTGYDSNAS